VTKYVKQEWICWWCTWQRNIHYIHSVQHGSLDSIYMFCWPCIPV